ncbi:MAG: LD-carboxypeptidase [Devosiaceae bacterium]|nr:LD-carboxypeptidase [Devosiaceae bacterium]
MNLTKPGKLRCGDTLAVVSPSWGGPGTFPERYEAGKKQLIQEFGVKVVEMPHALKPAAWLHLNQKARAQDFRAGFADPEIDAVITSIGGDDCIRLVPYLDFDVLAQNPKIFMGYSDTTVLHFACLKAGFSSFYGPSVMAGFGENGGLFPYMVDAVRRTLFDVQPVGDIPVASQWTAELLDWGKPENQEKPRALCESPGRICVQGNGVARGALIGGCIDVFPMMSGTKIWPDPVVFKGAILFLETSEEAPDIEHVKRIMRNLGVQGIFEMLTGILIGRPGGGVNDLTQYDMAIQSVVAKEFGFKNLPIVAQMDFGHTDPMCVLPYGATCEIDCASLRVSLMENTVVQ